MKRLVVLAALAAGCGGGTDPTGGRAALVEAGVRGLDRALGATLAFAVPGVVVTNQPEEVVASAVVQRARSETSGCAKASFTGASFDADFGAGCTLASAGATYAGTVHGLITRTVDVQPTKTTYTVTVALTLALTIDGQMLSGTIRAVTTDGNVFTYAADVMLAGAHATAPSLGAGLGGQSAAFDASGGTLDGAAGTFSWALDAIKQGFADCYPSGGTVSLTTPAGKETYGFANGTAGSGVASFAPPGAVAGSVTLPARAGCPR